MIKNRFFKETYGINAEYVLAKSLDTSNTGGTPQGTFEAFRQNGVAGSLGVFWDDTNNALVAGDTTNGTNAGRKFYYAYKMSDASIKRTTPIPVTGKVQKTAPYNAGVAGVWTGTFGGTYQVGQSITVRVQDTTGGITPYPVYTYEQRILTNLSDALAALAVQINGETSEKILSATSTGTTLVITCTDKNRTIKMLVPYLNTTTAQPVDGSVMTVAETTKTVLPLGTPADVLEFQNMFLVGIGNPLYYPDGTLPGDFYVSNSNVDGSVNYGYLVVTADRSEGGQGVVHFVRKTMTTIVCIATGALATLAAY